MNVEGWNRRYVESVVFVQKILSKIKGVVTAYNTNIDAVINVKPSEFEAILDKSPEFRENVVAKLEIPPNEILTREDLFVGVLRCMKMGIGQEWVIQNKEVFKWMEATFRDARIRMGGQAGIIGNTLAKLDVPNVIVHVCCLPKPQSSLFFENVKIPSKRSGRVVLANPVDTMRPDDEKMVHYVFEFDKETCIRLGEGQIEAPSANRLVATWDPKNTGLEIDPAFLEMNVGDEADRAVISGYHLLKPRYEDGSTHVDKIMRTVRQVRRWKEEASEVFIHLEMGDSKYDQVYLCALRLLAPLVDSVGLNENELLRVALSLGVEMQVPQEPSTVVAVFREAKSLLGDLGVPMVLVHTLDFSLCIIDKQRKPSLETVEKVQNAILFGALLAAARAVTGRYNSVENVRKEASNPALFLSLKGMREHENLARFLEESHGIVAKDFLKKGYVKLPNHYVVFVVSKITEEPRTTAGLGDSLIAGYMLGVK